MVNGSSNDINSNDINSNDINSNDINSNDINLSRGGKLQTRFLKNKQKK